MAAGHSVGLERLVVGDVRVRGLDCFQRWVASPLCNANRISGQGRTQFAPPRFFFASPR